MGAYKGTVTRPSNGATVQWTLAPVLTGIGRQLDKLGITWYSIGNPDHLRRSGGHTPWKPGAPYATVTAIDVMKGNYPAVEAGILRLMKNPVYDTSWIDFVNVNYRQYDWDGRLQRDSGDGHLHIETLPTRTSGISNLGYDLFGWPPGMLPAPEIKPVVTKSSPSITTLEDGMLRFVKVRSRAEIYLAMGNGALKHLTPKQYETAQAVNLKLLPSGASAAEKAKVTEPFVVEGESDLAVFGDRIVAQSGEVVGF